MASRDPVFVDTAYVFALINSRDQWHAKARKWEGILTEQRRPLLTSEFVLLEIADGLSAIRFRDHAVRVVDTLRASDHVEVVPATTELFEAGLERYRDRPDKERGLTDCTSFLIMEDHRVEDVLTTDRHFQQAGFRVVLFDET